MLSRIIRVTGNASQLIDCLAELCREYGNIEIIKLKAKEAASASRS